MKRKEKGEKGEVIKVQKEDLFTLKKVVMQHPNQFKKMSLNIKKKLAEINPFVVDYRCFDDWIYFCDEEDIDFFEKIYWIIDCDDYDSFEENEILKRIANLKDINSPTIINEHMCRDLMKVLSVKKDNNIKNKKGKSRVRKFIFNLFGSD